MRKLLTCPHGHQWQISVSGPEGDTISRAVCPMCGTAVPSSATEGAENRGPQPHSPHAADTTLADTTARELSAGPEAPSAAAVTLGTQRRPPIPPPGELPAVAGYELLRELGRGGMGVVYWAWQSSLSRVVALKMILAGRHAGSAALARFRAEAEAAARLQHPNIVQIYEVGEQDGRPFFSLEYVDGGSLAQKLAGTPMPARQAAQLTETLARAIHYAHQRGIVHRDLAPTNVLLTADGTPKITDFGLAKFLIGGGADQTQTGVVLGTPSYMAPEQAEGKHRNITAATDVYALGALLYDMLTGRPPFRAETPLDTLLHVISGEPVPPTRLQPKVPHDLETICLTCLQKEPTKRYASAQDLADDLHCFLNDEPIHARRAGVPERTWRWCRRNPVVASMIASVAVLLLVLAVGASISALWLRDERNTALANLARAEKAETVAKGAEQAATDKLWGSYLAQAQAGRWSGKAGRRFDSLDALARAAKIRPSRELRNEAFACMTLADVQLLRHGRVPTGSTNLAFDSDCRRYAWSDAHGAIHLCNVDNDEEIGHLPGFGTPMNHLRFSPDDRLLLARYAEGKQTQVRVWDLKRAAAVFQAPAGEHSWALDFSPDSRRVAVGWQNGAIRVYDIASGKETTHLQLGPEHYALCFDPDGRKLAVSRRNSPVVEVCDLDSGRVIKTLSHPAGVYDVAWSPDGKQLAIAGEDFHAYLWQVNKDRPPLILEGHRAQVLRVTFDHHGDLLATASWDGTGRLWDPVTGKSLVSYPADSVSTISFSRDDQRLAVALPSPDYRLYRVARGRECRTLRGHEHPGKGPWGVDVSPDGRWLASASGDGVRLWDLATARECAFLPTGVWNAAMNLDRFNSGMALFDLAGRHLLTSGSAGLHRWPIETTPAAPESWRIGPPRQLAPGRNWRRMALSRDGRTLAVVDVSREQVVVFDPQEGKQQAVLGRHPGVEYVAVSPEGRWIATSTRYVPVRIWDAHSGKLVHTLPDCWGHVAFSPEGQWLATGSQAHYRLWHTGSWQLRRRVQAHLPSAGAPLAFTRDGTMLAVAYSNFAVDLIDPTTGEQLARLEAPEPQLLSCLCFSRDGGQLAAGTENHIIHLWDLRRIRAQLDSMGLDWGKALPPPVEGAAPTQPPRVQVLNGNLH